MTRLDKILIYVEMNLHRNFMHDEIARLACLSEAHLSRMFHQKMGVTLTDYINGKRIERACYLLDVTDRSVVNIAYDCGFNTPSYFHFVFKQRMHVTPAKYRSLIA